MNAVPVRYARWMMLDLVRGPGLIMLLLGSLLVLMQRGISINGGPLMIGPDRLLSMFIILTTAGIVSRDLTRGYYRLLFAKPISPPLYYLQRWVLGAILTLIVLLLIAAGLAVALHAPMPSTQWLARVGSTYLLLGGLVFFLSTVTRYDWVGAVAVIVTQVLLGMALELGWQNRLAALLYRALPPYHLTDIDAPLGWHVPLYGLGLLVAALAVLRWRELGSAVRE